MEDVEVPPLRADLLGLDDFGGRQVIIRLGESAGEGWDVADLDFEYQVDVIGQPGFSVCHGCDRTGDQIA